MSLSFPNQNPVPAASAAGPGFPVYQPTETEPQQDPMAAFRKVDATNPDDEKELLFTIDGVDFFAPKNISPQIGFKMLRDIKRNGQMYAIATLIEELIGAECLDALADTKSMGPKDWDVVADILGDKVLGKVPNMPGKG